MMLTAPMLPSAAIDRFCASVGEFLDSVELSAS
jgi:hypothetical protein